MFEKFAKTILVEYVSNDYMSVGISYSIDGCVNYQINNWFSEKHMAINSLYSGDCFENSVNISSGISNLCRINKKGIALWLHTDGYINFRFTANGDIKKSSIKGASRVISAYCATNYQIVEEIIIKKSNDNKDKISINDLLLIDGERFEPHQAKEFFSYQEAEPPMIPLIGEMATLKERIFYINSFKPSKYMQITPVNNNTESLSPSIILQYIYHLSSYKNDRFQYILNWLASFFKNLQNRSHTALVLIGKNSSGKELLFDEIISNLFGNKYCIKITNYNLDVSNHTSLVKNKIFYNLDNLSTRVLNAKKNNSFINTLINDNEIYTETNKQELSRIKLYGQTLITHNDTIVPCLNLDIHNYTIFKVPDDIDSMYISKSLDEIRQGRDLIEMIRSDLENFAHILKCYSIKNEHLNKTFQNDDKNLIQLTLNNKLDYFHDLIINMSIDSLNKIMNLDNNLYQDMYKDFQSNKVKQKNIYKYFMLLYPEENITSPKTLMVNLRKIDDEFYSVKNIKMGEAGLKYFIIPNKI